MELPSVYSHLTNIMYGHINSEAKRTGRNALVGLLVANGAKEFSQMGQYYEPTTEKLDWIPTLEVYVGHVCKICYEEDKWVAFKSSNTMRHHFTDMHTFMGREGNTFTCEMQTIFGFNRARYFGVKVSLAGLASERKRMMHSYMRYRTRNNSSSHWSYLALWSSSFRQSSKPTPKQESLQD